MEVKCILWSPLLSTLCPYNGKHVDTKSQMLALQILVFMKGKVNNDCEKLGRARVAEEMVEIKRSPDRSWFLYKGKQMNVNSSDEGEG